MSKCVVKKESKPPRFWLVAEYDKPGVYSELDARLRKAVGRYEDGSGYFFGTGTRDLHWDYRRRATAEAAEKRLRAARIRGIRVKLNESTD